MFDQKNLHQKRMRNLPRRREATKTPRRATPILAFMTDAERTPDPEAALRTLPRGTLVIFRHYGAADRGALGQRLAALARRRGLIFFVAGDRRLARQLKADGLHLADGMVKRWALFAPSGSGIAFSAAAHDEAAVRRAAKAGACLVLMSPVFPTASHPGRPALGLVRLATACRRSPVPVLALGGVGPENVRRALIAGASGIAGIGALPRLCRDPFGWHAKRSEALAAGRELV